MNIPKASAEQSDILTHLSILISLATAGKLEEGEKEILKTIAARKRGEKVVKISESPVQAQIKKEPEVIDPKKITSSLLKNGLENGSINFCIFGTSGIRGDTGHYLQYLSIKSR